MECLEVERKILDLFEKTLFCTLATANKDGVVSASQVCLINDGLTIFVQTDKTFEKVNNIKENPNVAINCGAYYFKGKAEILGHPRKYPDFIQKVKQKHLSTYNSYTNLPNEVLIKIELSEAKIWGGDNSKDIHNQETILVVDLINKKTNTIICDKM